MNYDKFQIKFRSVSQILGGVPLSIDSIRAWTGVLGGVSSESFALEIAAQVNAENQSEEEAKELKSWTGFRKTEKGIYVPWFSLRAWLKEAADSAGIYKVTRGQSLRQVIENMHINPQELYLAEKPDCIVEARGRVSGPNYKHQIVRFMEAVNPGKMLEFWVYFINNPQARSMPLSILKDICDYAQYVQFGSGRSLGYGQMQLLEVSLIGQVNSPHDDTTKIIKTKTKRNET